MGLTLFLLWWIFLILTSLIVIVGICLIIYARWNYGKLDNLGFPVIKPHFCLGSSPNGHNEILHRVDYDRMKKYGKVYGVYDGRAPTVFVTDLDMIRLIQGRDFDHFRNHRMFLAEVPITSELLDFLDDEKWKTIRSMLTRNFTSGKIKQICDMVSDISQDYTQALLEDSFQGRDRLKMDFRAYLPPMIFEIIGKCFCGIDIQNARDPNNKFISNMKDAMGGDQITFDWTFTLINSFPILAKFLPTFNHESLEEFERVIRGIISSRESTDSQIQDFMTTLGEIMKKSRTDPQFKKLGINDNTALAQAFEFFIASYETLRSVLTHLIYFLAINPEIQKKLLEEINAVLERKRTNGKINWDTISEMPYLTGCIYETLRINPTFYRVDRRCTKDWEYNGIQIKKDMIVILPLWAIHHDENNYADPETFDPTRFLPENKESLNPYAFQAFGQGPRACIGQRFALDILKTVVVNFMKDLKFEKRNDTVLKELKGNPFFIFHEPIYVDVVKRH